MRGVNDALCDTPQSVPGWERGMFAFNMLNTAQAVTDGLSNTFMMGEGAQGSRFLVAKNRAVLNPINTNLGGKTYNPQWAWESGQVNADTIQNLVTGQTVFIVGGPFGVTSWKLNQTPVLQTLANFNGVNLTSSNHDRLQWHR